MILQWVLAAIMILFAAFQHNDPDALLWIAIYGLVAVWCLIAALRPGRLTGTPSLRGLVIASALAYAAGFVWLIRDYSPEFLSQTMMAPGVETTREAFGLLICALICAYLLWADGRAPRRLAMGR
jgi:hypothetical protein